MKFGEQLKRDAISEWRSKYLDYEALKAHLKDIPYAWRPHNLQKSLSMITNTTPLSEMEHSFVIRLYTEVEKVDLFYGEKEDEFYRTKLLLEHVLPHPLENQQSGNRKRMEQLRKACLETYRGLNLLRAFRRLNKIGFRKIIKKFDKVTFRTHTGPFMTDLSTTRVFSITPILNSLMFELEDIFTTTFASGDRHLAMMALRLPSDTLYLGGRLHHRSSFMGGFYFGASCILSLIAIVNFSLLDERLLFLGLTSIGLPLILLWGILIVELFCNHSHISFGFIIEFDPRDTLEVPQRSELLAFSTFLLIFVTVFFSQLGLIAYPIILFAIFIFILISPVHIYFSARSYLLKLAFETITSLIKGPIRFRHFFFGDCLMSLLFTLRSPVFLFSIYQNPSITSLKQLWTYTSENLAPFIILSILPSLLRMFQSYRRYIDDKKKSKTHLLNLLKYFFSFSTTILSTLIIDYVAIWPYWIFFSFISTIFSLYWDMVMDWGLSSQPRNILLLRNRGLLVGGGRRCPYYLLIVINTFLRLTWALPLGGSPWYLFLMALGEVIRRSIWTLFRLEHEHLNNCGEFKVILPAEEFGISLELIKPSPPSNAADLFPAL